ncbi:acyl-CoA dehydrogenase family protein [Streptomyces nigrescens]
MTDNPATPLVPVVDAPTADALAQALFAPDDVGRVHEPWRQLIAQPEFAYQTGLSERERIELAYRRLKLINERLDSPLDLATDTARLAGLHEWIAPADATCASATSIHHNLYLGSLAEADANPNLPRGLDGPTGVFLCTESACGNDAAELQTRAIWHADDNEFELLTPNAGAQKFMPNCGPAGGSKAGVVAARLHIDGADRGPMLFHVPLTDEAGEPLPGIRIRPLPEREGAPLDHSIISFHQVRLPAHALLQGDHGRLHHGIFASNASTHRAQLLAAIRRVTPGKLAMSASAIGVARTALAIAVRYGHHRYISGRPDPVPIVAHRTHAAPLVSYLAGAYAATMLHRQTLYDYVTGHERDRPRIERDIALTKAFTSWFARDAVTEARERCGANGLLVVNGIAGLAGSLAATITAEGDNLPILSKAAAEMVIDHVPPRPLAPVESLDSRYTGLPELRHLLASAEGIAFRRARERSHADGGHPRGLARWNRSSLPATQGAYLHAVGAAAEALHGAAEACYDRQARRLLRAMTRLFLLEQLRPHTGPLQADGHLTAAAEHDWPDAIEESIVALTPHMLTLVKAFNLDGYLAHIPIAHATYQSAWDDPGAHWNQHGGADAAAAGATPWSLAALRVGAAAPDDPHPRHSAA